MRAIEPDKFYLEEKLLKECDSEFLKWLKDQEILKSFGKDGLAYDSVCWLPFTTIKGYPDFWDNCQLRRFSFFKAPVRNNKPSMDITLLEVYRALTGSKLKANTEEFRRTKDRSFKERAFPYCTFSATCTTRHTKDVLQHSGLLCLDFDKLEEPGRVKKTLLSDPQFETSLLFTSPSGNGLKWIIEIDLEQGTHLEWFLAIENYLTSSYGLTPDKSGKDIVRACFLCHDSEAFINPKLLAYA